MFLKLFNNFEMSFLVKKFVPKRFIFLDGRMSLFKLLQGRYSVPVKYLQCLVPYPDLSSAVVSFNFAFDLIDLEGNKAFSSSFVL